MQNKTVLIAGATGMVGKALVPFLVSEGFTVHVLTRNVNGAKRIFGQAVGLLTWEELFKETQIDQFNFDVIINLVGANIGTRRWTKSYKQLILDSRINSVKNLDKLVHRMPIKPKLWVQASAVGYYGTGEGRENGFLAEVVRKWEEKFFSLNISDTRKVALRFGVVLSQTEGMLYQMKKAFNWGVAACPGNGKQMLTWIHIEDLIRIIHETIKNETWSGAINAVSPKPSSMWDFTKTLKSKTNAIVALKIPSFIFRMVLGAEKANELVLASQNVKPDILITSNFQYRFHNLNEAL